MSSLTTTSGMLPQSYRIVKTVSQSVFVCCFHSGRYEDCSLTTFDSLPHVSVLSSSHLILIKSHYNHVFVLAAPSRAWNNFDDVSAKAAYSTPFAGKGDHVAQDTGSGNSMARPRS